MQFCEISWKVLALETWLVTLGNDEILWLKYLRRAYAFFESFARSYRVTDEAFIAET